MKRVEDVEGWRWLITGQALLWLWTPVFFISVGHYATGAAHHWMHDIFRRLYYIPIVLGAFLFGRRGALAASFLASLIYVPHAFTRIFEHDPGGSIEKMLEIVLYNIVAYITGTLADREHAERVRQERTAIRLSETLDEVRAMEEQLVRSGRLQALGELTAGLAHEIKNPLGSLKGAVEIVADEIAEDSPRRKMIDIMRREIDRLNGLLERFLVFARPDNFEVREESVCEIVDGTLDLVQPQAASCGVKLRWERSREEMMVLGDREKIAQILINILLNGIQATPEGGIVKIRCGRLDRRKRSYGFFTVLDEGPGVPVEMKEKIFNPFFTTKEGGTGLGLSIAARIVDGHGGFIKTWNLPQGGAAFQVALPMKVEDG